MDFRIRNIPTVLRHFLKERLTLPLSLADQARYSPFLVQMVVTRKCNLRCGYCNEFDTQSEPVPLETLIRRIDAAHDLGALSIEFTGGEPLLHPDIGKVVRHATRRGFAARMMISNAYLFTPERIKELNEAGLTHLQVSIDGVNPNDMTIKVLAPLKSKLERIARHARFNVQLSGVIGAAPPAEVVEIVDFARKVGFTPRVLLIHGPNGQCKLNPDELAVYEKIKVRLGQTAKESHHYREKLLRGEPAPFKCRSGARYLYVDEFGLVHWCSQKRALFSKPLLEYTLEDLRSQFHHPKPCTDYCTVGCARTCSQFDERRS